MMLDIKVVKIGNSLSLRIPKIVAQQLHLVPGSKAKLSFTSTQIIIQPQKKKYTLKSLLSKITPENCHAEQFDDPSVGNEIG